MSDLELVALNITKDICQLTLNYSYLDAFQGTVLDGKIEKRL